MKEDRYLRISGKRIPGLVFLWVLFIGISRAGYETAGVLLLLGIIGYMIAAAE